jgi:large subunit ribosomal protein L18e
LTNPDLEKTIKELKVAGRKSGRAYLGVLSEELDKAKRSRVAVNLSTISRNTEEGDIAAVPGKVLASGVLAHPIMIAAYDYSDAALEKIKAAGGEAKTLSQLIADEPEAVRVKIIK